MKKWQYTLWGILAVFLIRTEHTGLRIEQLEPVQTLVVTQENHQIHIRTDTGSEGVGTTLESAVENLHTSASARIFLDTVEYLVIGTTQSGILSQFNGILRPAVRVCCIRGNADPEGITKYLSAHSPETILAEAGEKGIIPVLYYQEGRGQLVGENDP